MKIEAIIPANDEEVVSCAVGLSRFKVRGEPVLWHFKVQFAFHM